MKVIGCVLLEIFWYIVGKSIFLNMAVMVFPFITGSGILYGIINLISYLVYIAVFFVIGYVMVVKD